LSRFENLDVMGSVGSGWDPRRRTRSAVRVAWAI
jgi:hypothetical protein